MRPCVRRARPAQARADARRRVTCGQRRLEAFGRGYVLAKYRVGGRNPLRRAKIAALDWPVLAVHLVLRREAGPARERLRARSLGLRTPGRRAPLELATIGFVTAVQRQFDQLRLRFAGALPAHFTDASSGG